MRFNIYKESRVSLYLLSLILSAVLLFYFVASMFTSMGYKKSRTSNLQTFTVQQYPIIIIDAGHGGEDPGAVANEQIEKELNLEISLILKHLFESCGYEVVLTRDDDKLLYFEGEHNKKKYHDLRNRVQVANNYNNSVFVSIHMNKYSAEYCKGLQTFYTTRNPQSIILAESIQENVRFLQADNKRTIKDSKDTIYILQNIKSPSVLIECGFLSNIEEANLLKDTKYKVSLSLSIYSGITEYTENLYEN